MDVMTGRRDAVPDRTERPALRWSPAWVLEPAGPTVADPTLVLSAGADRRVAIDGLDPDQRAAVERWSAGGAIAVDTVDTVDTGETGGAGRDAGARRQAVARLLDRLVELGAVVPVAPHGPPTVLAVDAATARELRDLLTEGGTSGTVLAVRTGTAWPEVPPGRLHLGVDLSLHHTLVLGPLVIPGASACLACLDARVARRWPTPTVPAEPAVRRRLPVVAALLDVQLELIARGASPLVNATVSWNLETGTTDRQSLYKLAGCVRCDTGPGDGRVALPWGAAP
ncbi:MAG TPA: hypothetical protein VFY82_08085 [Acidimicrobiales bacterium]|nr:hypothetical protein [Acidimicrobiales bacterium]